MKVLNFKDVMKKEKLKNDTMKDLNYKKFIIILYTPEIRKYFQVKVL